MLEPTYELRPWQASAVFQSGRPLKQAFKSIVHFRINIKLRCEDHRLRYSLSNGYLGTQDMPRNKSLRLLVLLHA